MSDKVLQNYANEIIESLDRLAIEGRGIKEIKYFLDTAYHYFQPATMAQSDSRIILLGTSIPEEMVYAAGERPFWLLGGSQGAVEWSDDIVPRDTDPVHRSILGFLMQKEFAFAQKTLIVVPANCDSMRKIAYLLKRQGYSVAVFDFPAQKMASYDEEKWHLQLRYLAERISDFTKRRITKRSMQIAVQVVSRAKREMRQFNNAACARTDLISGALRMLVLNSYYYTDDIVQWTAHLLRLTKRLEIMAENRPTLCERSPSVLLMGSPVVFPNYKVPFLIQDVGMNIIANLDVVTGKTSIYLKPNSILHSIIPLLSAQFYKDISPAYAQNDALLQRLEKLIKRGSIKGVVYHVLKGQIEYDFELTRIEALLERYGVPVFRAETDYQYQDVEQLRIRMEAFCEMLTQNGYKSRRAAG